MSSRAILIKDQVTVMSIDGKTYTDIFPALVQDDMIIIMRHDIPIRRGDKISHRTSAGVEEIFIVENSSLQSGKGEIPGHYQVRVRRA
jgi:hypothetical protein